MTSYVFMTPPNASAQHEDVRVIPDGFSLLALIIPVLWFAWFRLWFAAAIFLLLSIGIAIASEMTEWGVAATFASVLLSFWAALEGQRMRITALERKGWTQRDVIEASDRETAEEIYFANRDSATDAKPRQRPQLGRPVQSATQPGSTPLGLFDHGNGR